MFPSNKEIPPLEKLVTFFHGEQINRMTSSIDSDLLVKSFSFLSLLRVPLLFSFLLQLQLLFDLEGRAGYGAKCAARTGHRIFRGTNFFIRMYMCI